MNKYVSDKPVLETDDFIIYIDEDMGDYPKMVLDILTEKKKNIITFFNLDKIDKVRIDLYNKKDNMYNHRKDIGLLTYEIGLNSGFFGTNYVCCYSDLSKVLKNKAVSNIVHEFVHSVYQDYVSEKGKRIVWLDEGLAQNLSGQLSDIEEDSELFKKWYLERIINQNKEIPSVKFLHSHGTKYGKFVDKETDKYNGYDISYLMVRYMIEAYDKDRLQSLLRNYNSILELEDSILLETIAYFNDKVNINRK